MKTAKSGLEIIRVFDSGVKKVWEMWTKPALVKKWWGPKDFTSPTVKINFKVGGKYLYCMRGAASPSSPIKDFWSTGVYKEIIPFKKIVITDSFSDEKGNIVPASYYGMKGDFPLELEVILTFEESDGKTKMTLNHIGIPSGEMADATKQGWNSSFDKIDEILKNQENTTKQKITPCLWFDNQAEEAVNFYVSIFSAKDKSSSKKQKSRIEKITRYDKAGANASKMPIGSVMTIEFYLNGEQFLALNGGLYFKFSGAISFIVNCDTQEEINYYWQNLSKGGEKGQCGWINRDKYGITWQVVPEILNKLLADKDPKKSGRVMEAMLKMTKIDISKLKKAHEKE